jgi:serine/threonine protein kinase
MQPPKDRVGDFEILREIGRGGMGVVYEAWQLSLKRKVALKVLAGGLGLTPRAIQRFQREATAAAKLHHTNIVPIYTTGEHEGVHYYAMELIEGPSLDSVIRQMRQPAGSKGKVEDSETTTGEEPQVESSLAATQAASDDEPQGASESRALGESTSTLGSAGEQFHTIARMIAEVADALDYAHEQGVIHRDIKPSNLLLSPEGRLSISDFGLARLLEEPGMTITGEFVGSPLYMSPEQITAGRAPVDHRTDIYSLGATLYELLALEPPFPGPQRERILAQIIQKEPKAPHRLNRRIPKDLETICLKALEKDPDRRYQSARQLADDLRCYLNRFAISARRAGPIQRAVKWARRRPSLATAMGCGLVLAILAGCWGWELRQERMERAKHEALAAAWAGDRPAVDAAIRRARRLGASREWAWMLEGQVALHTMRTDEAIARFEDAVSRAPGNVAAKAMLASAYLYKGQADRYTDLLIQLNDLSPKTASDYLFLGAALIPSYPQTGRAVDLLDKAVRMQPSGVSFLQLSLAQAFRAADKGDWDMAQQALNSSDSARTVLQGHHPMATAVALNARILAARRPEADRASLLAEAERHFDALESTAYHIGRMQRAFYLQLKGQEEAASREWQKAVEHGGVGLYATYYAAAMFGLARSEEALAALKQLEGPHPERVTDIARAYLLLEGGHRAEAEKVYRRVAAPGGYSRPSAETVLLFAGDRERAAANCARLLDPLPAEHPHRHLLGFLADQVGEKAFLNGAGDSLCAQCEFRFYAGLKHLARGEREGARRHFEQSVATGTHWLPKFHWSRAFLNRLEQEPQWPAWIIP